MDVAAQHPLHPRVIAGRNIGFGAAVNESVATLDEAVANILILNPDVYLVSPLQEILSAAELRAPFGCAGIRQMSPEGRTVWSWDHFPNVRLEWRKALRRPLLQRSPSGYDHDRQVDWVMGSFLLLPLSVFEEVGGFDDRYFLFFEEIDLCRRIVERGHAVWHLNDPYYVHRQEGKDTAWRQVAKLTSRHVYDRLWLTPFDAWVCRLAQTVRWVGDLVAPSSAKDRRYVGLRFAATWGICRADVKDGRARLRWAWQSRR